MRLPKIIFFILVTFSLRAQDSLSKQSLKLFEFNARIGTYINSYTTYSLSTVSRFTKHKEYVNENFTKGYSDTVLLKRRYFLDHAEAPLEIGIGASFKFKNTKSYFLKRVRPYLGLNYSSQRIFRYTMGHENKTKVDSLTFQNPAYPATPIDSVSFGEITYSAYSKLIFIETGGLFDIAQNSHFILYTGIMYGFGIGYENTFLVDRYKDYYVERSDRSGEATAPVSKTLDEPMSASYRFLIPAGIHCRYSTRHKHTISLLVELRAGSQIYKIKGEKMMASALMGANVGVRFYFLPFK